MKAIVWTAYGAPDVLKLQEVAKPTPKDNEILVKVHAASVIMGDCEMRSLKFPLWLALPMRMFIGMGKPRKNIMGQELAGEVETVGSAVTRFKVGDAVFGLGGLGNGGYAEYLTLPEQSDDGAVALKPAALTHEQVVSLVVGGTEALKYLRKANIQRGERVLIRGAGGSIGTYAIQLAKMYGAEVTAVDRTEKLDMMRSLGADHVIDYTREDFTTQGAIYDVIFDGVGKMPLSYGLRALKPEGRYLAANPTFSTFFRALASGSQKIITGLSSFSADDLTYLAGLMEAGTLQSIIDRRYPLEQVAEAHRYVESGLKQGNVVITVA